MANQNLHTDQELFRQIAEGDEHAFREIFYRYGAIIHPFILRMVKNEAVGREIVQEVFLRLWLKRETLAGIGNPSAWIYRVASNLALTHLRRRQLEARVLQGLRDTQPADPAHEALLMKELETLIHRAVEGLPPQRQKIFRLSREQGMSRKEIARHLHISENTVKNQLMISLKCIQEFIKKAGGSYIPFLLMLPVAHALTLH